MGRRGKGQGRSWCFRSGSRISMPRQQTPTLLSFVIMNLETNHLVAVGTHTHAAQAHFYHHSRYLYGRYHTPIEDCNTTSEPASGCTPGPIQCCKTIERANIPPFGPILSSLGIILLDLNILVGLNCAPMDMIGSTDTW
ncbi:hypothetical protein BDP27DRAFT_1355380 [Rhodocollybia butyracea]|uniref:Hydrophobin n=1 Tax=Rhodocollybia butyracea TaxID=206335 RepID=A0A9P5TUE4_9AGAR|nr:hypothetical protein BDP27DRAFT_1355380 [Rhodocollybia butyracea]